MFCHLINSGPDANLPGRSLSDIVVFGLWHNRYKNVNPRALYNIDAWWKHTKKLQHSVIQHFWPTRFSNSVPLNLLERTNHLTFTVNVVQFGKSEKVVVFVFFLLLTNNSLTVSIHTVCTKKMYNNRKQNKEKCIKNVVLYRKITPFPPWGFSNEWLTLAELDR